MLGIEAGQNDGHYTVTLTGELELATRDQLEAALNTALASDAPHVVLDLDQLTFIDSAGLATLLKIARTRRGDERLKMTRGSGEVAQMFRLTALDLVLPFE